LTKVFNLLLLPSQLSLSLSLSLSLPLATTTLFLLQGRPMCPTKSTDKCSKLSSLPGPRVSQGRERRKVLAEVGFPFTVDRLLQERDIASERGHERGDYSSM
jgi:hypothetical protein